MFPGANAQVSYNEAGEPVGWDHPDAIQEEWFDRDDRWTEDYDDVERDEGLSEWWHHDEEVG